MLAPAAVLARVPKSGRQDVQQRGVYFLARRMGPSSPFFPRPQILPPFLPMAERQILFLVFGIGVVAFSILKKCFNPNHTHELLVVVLKESKQFLILKLLLAIAVTCCCAY